MNGLIALALKLILNNWKGSWQITFLGEFNSLCRCLIIRKFWVKKETNSECLRRWGVSFISKNILHNSFAHEPFCAGHLCWASQHPDTYRYSHSPSVQNIIPSWHPLFTLLSLLVAHLLAHYFTGYETARIVSVQNNAPSTGCTHACRKFGVSIVLTKSPSDDDPGPEAEAGDMILHLPSRSPCWERHEKGRNLLQMGMEHGSLRSGHPSVCFSCEKSRKALDAASGAWWHYDALHIQGGKWSPLNSPVARRTERVFGAVLWVLFINRPFFHLAL